MDWAAAKAELKKEFGTDFTPLYEKVAQLQERDRLRAIKTLRAHEVASFGKWTINDRLLDWMERNTGAFKFALLSNNTRDTVDRFLAYTGAKFSAAISIDEVDLPKPHGSGIRRIMESCGVKSPHSAVILGDSPQDQAAGQAAGARYIVGNWFSDNVYCFLGLVLRP